MPDLPTGDVTFLFTDLEGSTKYWEKFPDVMPAIYDRHDAILRQAVTAHDGVIYKVIGDAIQAAFQTPEAGIAAAVRAQQLLVAETWPFNPAPRVRMALHLAQISPDAAGDYRSPLLNRVGRLLTAAEGSQILLSADIFQALGQQLASDLTLLDLGEHRFRDLTPQRVYQVQAPGIPAERARLLALSPHRDNLTPPTTSFVGRETEVREIVALLRLESTRLLTLLGPGGVGKTRLAQSVAAQLVDAYSDGVWFVPLDSHSDPAELPRAITSTVGIREAADQSLLAALIEHFSRRHTLLVLDNFEQIVDASSDVATLLRACPKLTVLATSRVPLDLSAEIEFPVSPLPIDDGATELFAERLRGIQPSFCLTPESRPIVVEICRRLDGLPLAIELAAARGRMLPLDKLLERLDERLPLLTGGPRDAPARQRALQSTIAWSVDLLSAEERTCFAGMSVFAGGATIDAVEPVLGTLAAPGSSYIDVLNCVENLVRHSLLRLDPSGRLTMLDTIREFASALLRGSDVHETLRRSHAKHFQELALLSQPLLEAAEQAETLGALFVELGNIRQALLYFEDHGPVSDYLEMVAALWRFWSVRGLYSEGRRWIHSAIGQGRDCNVEGSLLAAALEGGGILAESQGDAEEALKLHTESLAIWRAANDVTGIARSLQDLGILALHLRGDLVASRGFHAEALHHFDATNDQRGIASSLKSLADVALLSEEFTEASALYVRSLSIARQLHDTRGIAAGLTSLGALAFLEGDPARAIERYEEATTYWRLLDDIPGVALCAGNLGEALDFVGRVNESVPLLTECLDLSREIGDQQGVAFALTHLGRIARASDVRLAAQHYTEAAALSRSIGDSARLAESVEGLAGALLDAGHPDMAARLFGMSQAIRGQSAIAVHSVHQPALAKDLDSAKLALGPVRYEALVAEGFSGDLNALLPSSTLPGTGGRLS